jgi:hypothetical protein
MRWTLLLILFLSSCASHVKDRKPASFATQEIFGEVNLSKSNFKIFPPQLVENEFLYYFFLELKNDSGDFIDCPESEIEVKNSQQESLSFHLERVLRGRYYITVNEKTSGAKEKFDFYINNKLLRKSVKLNQAKIAREKSWLKPLFSTQNGIRFRLFLGDRSGKPVEPMTSPDIIITGAALVEDFQHIKEGVWEFNLSIPNYNQVIYLSVRAQGAYLADLYRIQHIEK